MNGSKYKGTYVGFAINSNVRVSDIEANGVEVIYSTSIV